LNKQTLTSQKCYINNYISVKIEKSINFRDLKINALMLLNYEQIKQKGIIIDHTEANYGNGSYNVRVGKLISVDGEEYDSYDIEPQGMVVAISKETFHLTDNVIGNATIKNSISNSGILAINIGIVDPGYRGHLSSVLINFGRDKYNIKSGSDFIRMTFHEFDKPKKLIPVSKSLTATDIQYINQKKIETKCYLDKTFLSLNRVEETIKKNIINSILKYVSVFSLIVAVLAFSIKTYFDIKNNYSNQNLEKIELMQEQVNLVKQEMNNVQKENIELKGEMDKMKKNLSNK
jgi:deoxycytidine triphosphate deaminase